MTSVPPLDVVLVSNDPAGSYYLFIIIIIIISISIISIIILVVDSGGCQGVRTWNKVRRIAGKQSTKGR